MFIAIEGVDGSGKTTQVARLVERVGGLMVPGCSGGPIGKLVRRALSGEEPMDPVEMQTAYTADRLSRDFALRDQSGEGQFLVSDRWTYSALVYGALHLSDPVEVRAHRKWLAKINEAVIVPNLYLVLCVEASVAVERLAKRQGKPEIYEREDTIKRVETEYRSRDIYERIGPGRIEYLEAGGTPDVVAGLIWDMLERKGLLPGSLAGRSG